MGIDLLDIMFRVERRWGIRISNDDLTQAGSRPEQKWDITCHDLMQLILARTRRCARCRYDLRGHAGPGRCPECGNAFMCPASEDECWRDLRQILAESLRVEPEDIQPDSLLIRDLGCT